MIYHKPYKPIRYRRSIINTAFRLLAKHCIITFVINHHII